MWDNFNYSASFVFPCKEKNLSSSILNVKKIKQKNLGFRLDFKNLLHNRTMEQ